MAHQPQALGPEHDAGYDETKSADRNGELPLADRIAARLASYSGLVVSPAGGARHCAGR
jgi:hypothetical protein